MLCSALTPESIPINSSEVTKSMLTSWWEQNMNCGVLLACFAPGWITKVQHSGCCWAVAPSSASPPCCSLAAALQEPDENVTWERGIQVPVSKRQLIFFLLGGCVILLVVFSFQSQKRFFSVFHVNNVEIQSFDFSGWILLVLQCKWMGMSAVLCCCSVGKVNWKPETLLILSKFFHNDLVFPHLFWNVIFAYILLWSPVTPIKPDYKRVCSQTLLKKKEGYKHYCLLHKETY